MELSVFTAENTNPIIYKIKLKEIYNLLGNGADLENPETEIRLVYWEE